MKDAVRYQVSDLTVDPGRGRVMRGDVEIALPKLSFDLLMVLIRDAPNLLSQDALMDKVWPGLVVSPETVSQRVKLLRDALDDDPKAPRYIGGLRGRGYQLIAPVTPLPPAETPANRAPPEIPASRAASEVPDSPAPALAAPSATPATIGKPPDVAASATVASPAVNTLEPATGISRLPREGVSPVALQRPLHRWMWISVAAVILVVMLVVLFVRRQLSEPAVLEASFNPPPHSVAVLSFVNMSGDPQQEYFAQGLAEELSNSLAHIKDLQVVARTSSFSFKGKDTDIPTVARKLNVGAVLEGSVRKMGDRVRITAQLINALTGYHLWSQVYDRELNDVFRVQSEIAMAVSGALKITLLADEKRELAPGSTHNPLAFDAYLRGRYGEAIQDEAGLRSALTALDEAIALDPQYAQALAFRADVTTQIAGYYVTDEKERDRMMAAAHEDAAKAVKIAPLSGLAHSTLGTVLSMTGSDYRAADAAYRRSVELEPGSAEILHTYASYAATFGRPDALTAARRAVSLDPLDLGAHANLGVALYYAHRFEEAAAAFREALRLGTNRVTINWLGFTELAMGQTENALQHCTEKDFGPDQICLAIAYHALGRQSDANAMLEKLMAGQKDFAAYQYAEIYASWGDTAKAMHWLHRAVELQDGGLLAIKTDPFLDPLRKLPEFNAIVEKLGLPK